MNLSVDEAAAAAQMAKELLAAGDPVWMTARGASMRPFLRDGDRVHLRPLADKTGSSGADPVRLGAVVLVPGGDFGRLHRVVLLAPGGWVATRGDALPRIDGWFQRHEILAVADEVVRGGVPVPPRPRLALAVSWGGALARQTLSQYRSARQASRSQG